MMARFGVPLFLALVLGAALPVSGDEGEALYREQCAGCHGDKGEGGGDASPLAGSEACADTARLTKVIREGTGAMPGFPELNGGRLTALVRFVQTGLGARGGGSPAPAAAERPAGDPKRGSALFTGRTAFAQGGAACAACHKAGGLAGGCLGQDLTHVAKRYGGGRLDSVLEAMPFRVMRASYVGKELRPQEAADLAAFFQSLDGRTAGEARWVERFWVAGILGAAVLFAGVASIGSRRGVSPTRRLRRVLTRGRKG